MPLQPRNSKLTLSYCRTGAAKSGAQIHLTNLIILAWLHSLLLYRPHLLFMPSFS